MSSDNLSLVGAVKISEMRITVQPMKDRGKPAWKWFMVAAVLLVVILAPFFLAGGAIERGAERLLQSVADRRAVAGVVLAALLAGDILLPVPSSIVSTAAGYLLGPLWGTLASAAGMTAACALGFGLARRWGVPLVRRFVGAREMQRLSALHGRYADWLVIMARPVPVLAEASVLFLGMTPIGAPRFLALSALSNLGISAVYACTGAWATGPNAFLPAVAASVLLPWLLMTIFRSGGRRLPAEDVPCTQDGCLNRNA